MKTEKNIGLAILFVITFQVFTVGLIEAKEEEYPEKPIQFLVGYAPGSLSDLAARAISRIAPKYLGKPTVIVNMPGASSTVALNELAKSAPDGHTIATMTHSYKALTVHQQKIPFDPKILKPVLGFAEYRMVLFVRGDSPFAKLEDFVAYGQKNREAITYGHAGRGVTTHLAGELFFRSANIKATDVPYKGATWQGVAGGHILAAVTDTYGLKQHVSAGTLRILVSFVDQRLKEFPDVPTSQEKGYADVSSLNSLLCVAVHRDTPIDRAKKLHEALKKVVEDPEFVKIMGDIGLKCGYIPPETLEETISKTEKLGFPLLKELKLFIQ